MKPSPYCPPSFQVRKFVGEFGGALVEEFIEGREFTVLVSENPSDPSDPCVHMPVECVFGAGETFKHFDLKWRDYESMRWVSEGGEGAGGTLLQLSPSELVAVLHHTLKP